MVPRLREWTSLLSKASSLSINCKQIETVSAMESPQITPHPEGRSQCSGRASASEHKPGQRNISYHKDMSRLMCEKMSLFQQTSKQVHTLSKPLPSFRVDFFLIIYSQKLALKKCVHQKEP